MRMAMRRAVWTALAWAFMTCFTTALAFYVPVSPTLKGLGNAHVQAMESEFSSLEQAALLFRSEDPSRASSLEPGVNHIGVLAQYTDVPGHFSDTSRYGFLADARGWWVGIAVPGADSTREYVAQAAQSKGWYGSPHTTALPYDAGFAAEDQVVWKLLRGF